MQVRTVYDPLSPLADLAETLAPGGNAPALKRFWRRQPGSLIDCNIGAHLRRLREQRQGRWQGSFDVPQRSIVLCAGLPTERDELVSELLARALRETGIDARSTPLPLPDEEHRSETAKLICTVFLPCPLARTFETWRAEVAVQRALLPDVLLVAICLPDDESRI